MKRFLLIFFVLAAPQGLAMAQQSTLLSPPETKSVPLSEADQQKALASTPVSPALVPANPLARAAEARIVVFPGLHISSGNSQIDSMVNEAAARYRLDPCLIISNGR